MSEPEAGTEPEAVIDLDRKELLMLLRNVQDAQSEAPAPEADGEIAWLG